VVRQSGEKTLAGAIMGVGKKERVGSSGRQDASEMGRGACILEVGGWVDWMSVMLLAGTIMVEIRFVARWETGTIAKWWICGSLGDRHHFKMVEGTKVDLWLTWRQAPLQNGGRKKRVSWVFNWLLVILEGCGSLGDQYHGIMVERYVSVWLKRLERVYLMVKREWMMERMVVLNQWWYGEIPRRMTGEDNVYWMVYGE
jgi:hypothetical protein